MVVVPLCSVQHTVVHHLWLCSLQYFLAWCPDNRTYLSLYHQHALSCYFCPPPSMMVPFAVPHLCVITTLNCRSIADTTCINVLIATVDYRTGGNAPSWIVCLPPLMVVLLACPQNCYDFHILISTDSIRLPLDTPMNILLAWLINMSVICCTSFIYSLAAISVSSFTTPITLVVKAAIPGGAYIKADINKESTERRQ